MGKLINDVLPDFTQTKACGYQGCSINETRIPDFGENDKGKYLQIWNAKFGMRNDST